MLPATWSLSVGESTPTPMLPPETIENRVALDDEVTINGLVLPLPFTERVALGEVVPIPTFTASAPVPPRTIEFDVPTRAFLPIAVMFVSEGSELSREAW